MNNDDCFAFTSEYLPRSLSNQKLIHLPLGVNINPFNSGIAPVNRKLYKCSKCGSYIFENNSCSFCNKNPYLNSNALHVDEWIEDETNIPKTLILIDGSKVSNSCGFFQEVINHLNYALPNNLKKFAVGVYSQNLMLMCSKGIFVFPTFDDIEIPDLYFLNCVPNDFKALLDYNCDNLENHFEILNFARKIVGKNGKIIMMISSAINGHKKLHVNLNLTKIKTNNFTQEWKKLQDLIKLNNIKVDIFVNIPPRSSIDSIFFIKFIEPLFGNYISIRESQIHNIKNILKDFFDNFVINIKFLSLDLFEIKNSVKMNGVLTKIMLKNSKQNNTILLTLNKVIYMNSIPFQSIITYTNFEGKNVIRVFSKYISITDDLLLIIESINQMTLLRVIISDLIYNYMNRQMGILELKNRTISLLFPILSEYRKMNLFYNSNKNELLIPKSLDCLPLYCLGILKSSIFCFGVEQTDRNYFIYQLNKLSSSDLSIICYPHLYYLNDYLLDDLKQPKTCKLKKFSLDSSGIYLMYDGFSTWIWVGKLLSEDLCLKLFNCSETCFIEDIQQNENKESEKLFNLIKNNINLCVEDRFGNSSFIKHMIEDETIDLPSYQEYLDLLKLNVMNQ